MEGELRAPLLNRFRCLDPFLRHQLMRLPYIFFGLRAFESSAEDEYHAANSNNAIRLLDYTAFGMHIWFTESKGINIRGRIQVRQTVVHEAMRSLVRPDSIDDVQQFCILWETPVVDGNFRRRLLCPMSERSVNHKNSH